MPRVSRTMSTENAATELLLAALHAGNDAARVALRGRATPDDWRDVVSLAQVTRFAQTKFDHVEEDMQDAINGLRIVP
ncbi:hypothetical protein CCP3SC15_680011 [Gammaproteobacteria bacterium]